MAAKESPESAINDSGFPMEDLWEEAGAQWERLHDDGLNRDVIDRQFERARKLEAGKLSLTQDEVRRTLSQLHLTPETEVWLSEKLYYLAGHFYSPRFHQAFVDDPVSARRRLGSVASTAAKLNGLISELSFSEMRNFNAIRLQLHSNRDALPFVEWREMAKELSDVEHAAKTVAAEIPVPKRGTNPKNLQRRWLLHAVEAIEHATGRQIETKASDSAGKNFRLLGDAGMALRDYCKAVDHRVAVKTIVDAVRAFHRAGIGPPPS